MWRKAMPRCTTWVLQHWSLRKCILFPVTEGVLARMPRAKVTENALLELHLQNQFKFCTRVAKSLYFCSVNRTCLYSYTRYVRKVMRLSRENSFNWRYVYTHLIFFKITSLSINTPLPPVLSRVVARLEVLNWDLFQSIRHGSLHVFNSPKMVSFQAGFEPGKQKESSTLPGKLRRVTEPLATVYWCSRMLFWRILSVCKHIFN